MDRISEAAFTVAIFGVVVIVAVTVTAAACEDVDRSAEQRAVSRAAAIQMTPPSQTPLPQVAARPVSRPTAVRAVSHVRPLLSPAPIRARSPETTPLGSPTSIPTPRVTAAPTPTSTPTATPTATPSPRPTGVVAHVLHVVDGDTIDVQVNGYLERVRLLKVDTPERGCPLFDAATVFVRERVLSKRVVLNFPSGTPEWDVYGRLLAEVHYQRGGGVVDLGSELLEAGLAMPYVPGGSDCLPPG